MFVDFWCEIVSIWCVFVYVRLYVFGCVCMCVW